MSLTSPHQIIIASYHEFEWDRWRTEAHDGASFFADSYNRWSQEIRAYAAEKTRGPIQVYLVPITISDFLAWAERNGRTTDAIARDEYARLNMGQFHYN